MLIVGGLVWLAAGAIVAREQELGQKVVEVLSAGARGTLQLSLHGEEEYFKRYHDLLISCGV